MARQYARVTVRGVGGGRMSARRPSAPRIASLGNGRVRVVNGKRKA